MHGILRPSMNGFEIAPVDGGDPGAVAVPRALNAQKARKCLRVLDQPSGQGRVLGVVDWRVDGCEDDRVVGRLRCRCYIRH